MDTVRSRRFTRILLASACFGVLLFSTACGGGGGSNPAPPPPPSGTVAPSGLSYQTPQVYTVGQAITAVNPTVTGTVSSYSISPALPAGLAINATSGVISGTPTALAAQATYTVTANNSAGSTTAAITLTINDVKPTISYGSSTIVLATDVPITKLVPSTSGGAVVSWSITPSLPTGLSFDTADGSITGTPASTSAATVYTIAATNSGGQASFALTLAVQSGTLLDAGHMDSISTLRFDGTHVVSVDVTGHWVLWSYSSGAMLASGASGCTAYPTIYQPPSCTNTMQADLVGSVFVLQTTTGLEVRSPADGHVMASIATTGNYWWKLATDGSYIVAGNGNGLEVWSTAGVKLLTKAGGYNVYSVFPAPGKILASLFPFQNVIETTSIDTGLSTDSPQFNGGFDSWFADGSRFQTQVTGAVLTYSPAAVQQDITALPSSGTLQLVGTGNWFAQYDSLRGTLNVYKVGASGSPAATFTLPVGETIVALNTMLVAVDPSVAAAQVTVIDLSGTTPVRVDQPTPVTAGSAYTALSTTQWLFGNSSGVVFDGASSVSAPRYLGYGAVTSIAGSGARVAISTASGRILHYDAATRTLEGAIQNFSSKVGLSADGTVLAGLGLNYGPPYDPSTKVYSLPGGGVLSTWPNTGTGPVPADIALSASGAVLGLVYPTGASTVPVVGGTATWTTTSLCPGLRLSSDAAHIACASSTGMPEVPGFPANDATLLYNNGQLVSALNGLAVGWLDDSHLLVNTYQQSAAGAVTFSGVSIYDPTGTMTGTSALPEVHTLQALTPDTIYWPEHNAILSVSTGQTIWSSADDSSRKIGAVAGGNVVFVSGTQVLILPH